MGRLYNCLRVSKLTKNDLSGEKFGRWTVLREYHTSQDDNEYWLCRCVCGLEQVFSRQSLENRKVPAGWKCWCVDTLDSSYVKKVKHITLRDYGLYLTRNYTNPMAGIIKTGDGWKLSRTINKQPVQFGVFSELEVAQQIRDSSHEIDNCLKEYAGVLRELVSDDASKFRNLIVKTNVKVDNPGTAECSWQIDIEPSIDDLKKIATK